MKVDEGTNDEDNVPKKKNDFSKVNFDNIFNREKVNDGDMNEVPPLEEFDEEDIPIQNASEGVISIEKFNEDYFKAPVLSNDVELFQETEQDKLKSTKNQIELGDFECTSGTSDDKFERERESLIKEKKSLKNKASKTHSGLRDMLSFAYKAGATDGNHKYTDPNTLNNIPEKVLVTEINEPTSNYTHNESTVEGIFRQNVNKTTAYSDIFNISEESKHENNKQSLVNALKKKKLITELDDEEPILPLSKNMYDIPLENESERIDQNSNEVANDFKNAHNNQGIEFSIANSKNFQEKNEVVEESLMNSNSVKSAKDLPEFHLVESHMNDLKKLMKQYNELDEQGMTEQNLSCSKENEQKKPLEEGILNNDKRKLEDIEETGNPLTAKQDLPSLKHLEFLDVPESIENTEKNNYVQLTCENFIQQTGNHSAFSEEGLLSDRKLPLNNRSCNVLQDVNGEHHKEHRSNASQLHNENQIEIELNGMSVESFINSYAELTFNENSSQNSEYTPISDIKIDTNTKENVKTEIVIVSEKNYHERWKRSIQGNNKIKIYEDADDTCIASANKSNCSHELINYNATINKEKSSTESTEIITGVIEEIYTTFLNINDDKQTEDVHQINVEGLTEKRDPQETKFQINKDIIGTILKHDDNSVLVYGSDDDELTLLSGYSGPHSFDNVLLKHSENAKILSVKKSQKNKHNPEKMKKDEVPNKTSEDNDTKGNNFLLFGRPPINQCTFEIGELEINEQNIPETKTYEIYVDDEDKIENYDSSNVGINTKAQDQAIEKYNRSCKENEKIVEEIKKMIFENGIKNESTEIFDETSRELNRKALNEEQTESDNFNKTEILYNNYISNSEHNLDHEHAIMSENNSSPQNSAEFNLKINYKNDNDNMDENSDNVEEKGTLIQKDENYQGNIKNLT